MNQKFCSIVAATAVFSLAGVVSGQPVSYSWTGAGDATNWADAANWDQATYPGQTNDDAEVTISSGTGAPVLSDPLTNSVRLILINGKSLSVGNTGHVSVDEDVTVTGTSAGIVVQADGEVEITGDLTVDASFGATVASDGLLTVHGVVTIEDGVTMTMNGLADLRGQTVIKPTGKINLNHATAQLTLGGQLVMRATSTQRAEIDIMQGVVELEKDGDHFIGGDVRIDEQGTLRVKATMAFKPYDDDSNPRFGQVRGLHNNAQLLIDAVSANVTLVNEVRITGAMTINRGAGSNTATLDNLYVVEANDLNGGTLTLGADLEIFDDADALWAATANLAVLRFVLADDSECLLGTFRVTGCGRIELDEHDIHVEDFLVQFDFVSGTFETSGAAFRDCPGDIVFMGCTSSCRGCN